MGLALLRMTAGGAGVTAFMVLCHVYLASGLPGAGSARAFYDLPVSGGIAWSTVDLLVPVLVLANVIGRSFRLEWPWPGKVGWIVLCALAWMGVLIGLLPIYALIGLWPPPPLRAPGQDCATLLEFNYRMWSFWLVMGSAAIWAARSQERIEASRRGGSSQ